MATTAVVSTIASIVTSAVNGAVTILKTTFEFIGKIFYGFGLGLFIGFQGIFGFLINRTEDVVNDLQKKTFDPKPNVASDTDLTNDASVSNPLLGFWSTTSIILETIRSSIQLLIMTITPLIAFLPYMFIGGVAFFLLSYLIMIGSDVVIIFLEAYRRVWVIGITLGSIQLNIVNEFLAAIAPSWNVLVDFMRDILLLLLDGICPNPSGTSIFDKCPIIETGFNFILTNFNLLINLVTTAYATGANIFNAIGNLFCPGGTCSSLFCDIVNDVLGQPCDFGITTFFKWALSEIAYTATELLPLLQIFVLFISDMLSILVSNFSQLVSGPGSLLTAITPLVLPTFSVPSTFQNVVDVLLFIEGVTTAVAGFMVGFLVLLLILVDTLVCNVILDFYNCAAAKTCYLLFQDISIYILGYPVVIPISSICGSFGFNRALCNCDKCPLQNPLGNFTIPLWNYIPPPSGNPYVFWVPCTLNPECPGGCDDFYSFLPKLFPY